MKYFLCLLTLLMASQFAQAQCNNGIQAKKYEKIMEGTMYLSEADYPWEAFASNKPVDAEYTEVNLRVALDLDNPQMPIDVSSLEESLDFFDYYILENPYEDDSNTKYFNLLKAFIVDFGSDFREIRYGRDDLTSEIEVFFVGRDANGCLIGLKTISIET